MSTATEKADLEAILSAINAGRKIDPEVAKRVRQRSEELRKNFDREISVELIRSLREE